MAPAPLRLRHEDAYYAAALVQSSMLLYGLVAALTAVGVWQRYAEVSDIVSGEATAIASLWRDLGGDPQPLRDTTRSILRGYTKQIIVEAWPQQRVGLVPTEGVEWMDRLQTQLFTFEPATQPPAGVSRIRARPGPSLDGLWPTRLASMHPLKRDRNSGARVIRISGIPSSQPRSQWARPRMASPRPATEA
jgi:hypothetical protein